MVGLAWGEPGGNGIDGAVLETGTAALEGQYALHLAQAQSNAAPRGRKSDYVDALRLARRFLAAELRLSFVPDAEQRTWRCVSRNKHQKRQRRVQIQNQIEALLEESQIKLSSVITDLYGGLTGYRILKALARGGDGSGQSWWTIGPVQEQPQGE